MTYAMTLDNAWELMTEEEMYDVNGGGAITITISRELVQNVAAVIAGGGTGAVVNAYLAPTIAKAVGVWLLVSTSLGPLGMGIMMTFAAGATVALSAFIAAQAASYLAGQAYDLVFTVASGFLVPNLNLSLG